ncbi:6-pyruvoyl-tetrahydropterin synthase-related protein [Thermodesulfovibrio sp. 3907-1M]|uniref:6-pyruvoyl-tetrahydropterin synthase-related protein n=1 Tax=Thermodesulfovibrio autotrophicus TaxID=3118333 RepID=A0AAU8H1U6_9BACT
MLEKLKKLIFHNLSTFVVFCILYLYLLYIFKPSLIFLDTTVSGGDTGSHNYVFYYLKRIFPSIHGWSNDWYCGFPFLYFYPPLLYVLSVLLSYLIPANIAFKIATLLGTFILPLSSYFCLKTIGKEKVMPEVAAILSLFFLFLEQYSIYGGNIPSTLAGEFSYSFSFSIFWLFIALMKKGMEDKKCLISNTFLLLLMVLSHPIPVMVSVLIMPFFVLLYFKKNFSYILKVYVLAFIFTSWWSLPFVLYFDYTSAMIWRRFIRVSDLFPSTFLPIQIVALAGTVYGLVKRDKNIMLFLFVAIISFFIYLFLDNSKIWNTRFLPFFAMSCVMLAAYFLGCVLKITLLSQKPSALSLSHSNFKIQSLRVKLLVVLTLIATGSIFFINSQLKYIPSWVKWNYEGFEKKQAWNEVNELFEFLKSLPYGRVMWQYTSDYGRFGTPRILELIPFFSGKPTMEGLLIESSVSAALHFIVQAETTHTPTSPDFGFQYPSFNMKKAVEHMKLLGIRYFIAYTDDVKEEADRFLQVIGYVGRFKIYQIPDVKLVEPIFDFEIQKKEDWLIKSVEWFKKGELWKPIIFTEKNFKKPEIKNVKCVLIKFEHNEIIFYTEGIGIPHIIKVSYFPKWKAEGAQGPYLISPSFMVVFPEKNYVRVKWK